MSLTKEQLNKISEIISAYTVEAFRTDGTELKDPVEMAERSLLIEELKTLTEDSVKRKRGRPKANKRKVPVTLQLFPEIIEQAQEWADKKGLTRQELIQRVLKQAFVDQMWMKSI